MLPRSNGPPRGRVGARASKPRLVALMRFVAVVGVLVACVHAGVWAVSRDVVSAPDLQRPARQRLLHAVRRLGASRQRQALDRRADPRRPEGASRPTPGWSAPIPRPAAPSWCRRSPASSACASRSAPGSTRTPSATSARCARSSISPAGTATSTASWSATRRSSAASRPSTSSSARSSASSARPRSPVTTGEIWQRLDRASGARVGGRLHRRARPALLGRHLGDRRGRSGDPHLRPAAPGLSRQAHRDRRVRLAERRLQPPRRQSRPAGAGRACCATSSPAPRRSASTTTSSKPTTSRGRRSKAASAPTGACSTPRAQPKFSWTGPITDPDHWKLAGIAVLIGVLLSLPILVARRRDRRPGRAARGRGPHRRRLVCDRVRLLERALFRAGRGLRLRARRSCCWSR